MNLTEVVRRIAQTLTWVSYMIAIGGAIGALSSFPDGIKEVGIVLLVTGICFAFFKWLAWITYGLIKPKD